MTGAETALVGLTSRQSRAVLNAVASGHLEGWDASDEHIARLAEMAADPVKGDDIIAELVAKHRLSS